MIRVVWPMLSRVTLRGVADEPAKHPNRLEHPECSSPAHLGASMRIPGQTGSWDLARSSPNAAISDCRPASEELTEYTAPHCFAYWRSGFPNALHHLAERLWGEGAITPDGLKLSCQSNSTLRSDMLSSGG